MATLRDLSENGIWLTLPNNLLIVGDLTNSMVFGLIPMIIIVLQINREWNFMTFALCIGMARFNPLCTKVVNILRTVLHVKLWVIDKHASSPFLLCLSYNAVHSPWRVPEHYVNRLEGRRFHHEDRKVFAAMVLALDDGIGRVMESLRKNGLEENTLFILISDNGSPRGQGIECSTGYEYKDRGVIRPCQVLDLSEDIKLILMKVEFEFLI